MTDPELERMKKLIEENPNPFKKPPKDAKRSAREIFHRRRQRAVDALEELAAAADDYAGQPGKIKHRDKVKDIAERSRDLRRELGEPLAEKSFDDTAIRQALGMGPRDPEEPEN